MKYIKRSLPIILTLAVQTIYAVTTPRIDLQGIKGEVQFKNLKVFGSDKAKIILARWKWVKGDSYALATFKGVKAKTWNKIGIKFTPANKGRVKLMLLGSYERSREGIVYYDGLELQGADIANPDFEEIDSKTKLPLIWKRMNLKKNVETLACFSKKYKKSASISAQVHHDSRIYQIIEVEKDKPVIIEMWVYIP